MFVAAAEHTPATWRKAGETARAEGKIYRSHDGGKTWQRLGGGIPESLKHEFGALCLEETNGNCSIFGGTTGGGNFFSGENSGGRAAVPTQLGPVLKKRDESLFWGGLKTTGELNFK